MILVAGQEIEVHDLQWNQGILALDFGACKLIKTYNNLIHIIDVSAYKEGTKTLENNIKSFKNLPDVEKTYDFRVDFNVIAIKITYLKAKYNVLSPFIRNKRRLLNFSGSLVKTITVNMDNKDAEKLNNQIK